MSVYIKKSGPLIVERFSGPVPEGEEYEADPKEVAWVGADRRFWGPSWEPIPIAALHAEGLVTAPWGTKWNGTDGFEPMSLREKVEGGHLELPEGQVLDGETVRVMTPSELGRSGHVAFPVLVSMLTAMIDARHSDIFDRGFDFRGTRFSGKKELQAAATGIVAAMAAGLPVPFPQPWPDALDNTVEFATLDDFRGFCVALMTFVQTVDRGIGQIKTAIRSASSTTQAADLFDQWEGTL